MAKKIFVAATGQHKGKTTCTLGIAAVLKAMGHNVGYCKPVGQNHLLFDDKMVDKDVVLFEKLLEFKIQPEVHSPVIIASGVTAEFINHPERFEFDAQISHAAKRLEEAHEVIVFEGTGHVGVGSVVNLSNADVAKMLGADVILVAEGGIGSSFDRMNLNLSLFREKNVSIKGVIINKVHPDKLERVKANLEIALSKVNIPVIGVLPYDRVLSFPLMSTIQKSIKGDVLLHPLSLNNRVEDILAGSSIEINEFTYFQNLLLIVTSDDLHDKIKKIKKTAEERDLIGCPLSGVIITGFGKQQEWLMQEDEVSQYLLENKIPLLTTKTDTYDTVVIISQIEVKINSNTPWKINRAIELIQDNVDLENLL